LTIATSWAVFEASMYTLWTTPPPQIWAKGFDSTRMKPLSVNAAIRSLTCSAIGTPYSNGTSIVTQ
jgi:hypothetical protein